MKSFDESFENNKRDMVNVWLTWVTASMSVKQHSGGNTLHHGRGG